MNRIQEHIINYQNNKEDKNWKAVKEELTLLTQILGVNKKLSQAIADYKTDYAGMGNWMVIVDYKGKEYWEKVKNNREEKFQALGNIFNRIREEEN